MQLVGAPQMYVRGPFVMEGVLQGGDRRRWSRWRRSALAFLARASPLSRAAGRRRSNLSSVRFLPIELCVLLVAGGMAVGCLGGLVAAAAGTAEPLHNLDTCFRRHYTGRVVSRPFISRTCMPRFVTDSRPISAQHPLTEFYREEFLKHHRCLQQQRPYYSESGHHRCRGRAHANHGTARATLHQRQRPPASQLPPQEIRCRHRPFGLVRSQAHTLIPALARSSTRPPRASSARRFAARRRRNAASRAR